MIGKIENSKEKIQVKIQQLNDVDKKIKSSHFEKSEIRSLQRSVYHARKRFTLLQQKTITKAPEKIKTEINEEIRKSQFIQEKQHEINHHGFPLWRLMDSLRHRRREGSQHLLPAGPGGDLLHEQNQDHVQLLL